MGTQQQNPYRMVRSASASNGGGNTPAPSPVREAVPQARVHATPKTAFTSHADEAIYDENGTFNPRTPQQKSAAIREALGSVTPSADGDRMFDKSGQVNAHDTKQALEMTAYLLNNIAKKASPGTFYREASTMAAEDRRKVLAAAMSDPSGEGFALVGQELLLPIKDIVDYEGWARKVFRVRPLAQGELFRIAKDVRATAWVIGQDGQAIESRLYGKYIQPSEFKIAAFPTVDIEDIYQMNFDVLDRAQDTARQEIELEEDKRALNIIDRASQTVNATTIFTTLSVSAFEDVRYQVERHRLVVEKFLINRRELTDLVKTAVGLNGTQHVDPVTERELILAGYVGNVLNCQIITAAGTGVEEVVPAGTFYAVTGSEYMGEMGVRIELFSEPFNKFANKELVKGWAFGELIGFGIPNSRAVAKGMK